jgi:hypothetical protein
MNTEVKSNKRTPVSSNDAHPGCYGDPEQVSPKDERGLIEPQAECLGCGHLRSCLQKALRKQGLIRPPLSGVPGATKVSNFLKRWSERKLSNTTPPDDVVSR